MYINIDVFYFVGLFVKSFLQTYKISWLFVYLPCTVFFQYTIMMLQVFCLLTPNPPAEGASPKQIEVYSCVNITSEKRQESPTASLLLNVHIYEK